MLQNSSGIPYKTNQTVNIIFFLEIILYSIIDIHDFLTENKSSVVEHLARPLFHFTIYPAG